MKTQTTNNQAGFVALISALILMVILVAITFALSTSGFFLRFATLDSEFKKTSLGLAEACVNSAFLDLAQASVGSLPKTVPVGTDSCKICSINTSVTPNVVVARAVSHGAYSNVTVAFTKDAYSNFTINSWKEVATNPSPGCTVP